MQKPALYTAAAFFALGALAHWMRAFLGFDIIIGDMAIPILLSVIAGVAAALIAIWMFTAARRA